MTRQRETLSPKQILSKAEEWDWNSFNMTDYSAQDRLIILFCILALIDLYTFSFTVLILESRAVLFLIEMYVNS